MGRKIELDFANEDLINAINSLRAIRAFDVKARKSRKVARLKPKFTADIKSVDLLIDTIVIARKLLRGLPKAVQ